VISPNTENITADKSTTDLAMLLKLRKSLCRFGKLSMST